MERVALIVDATGQRLQCMLNPSSLVQQRSAGIRRRRSAGGLVTGAELADDPLLYTGGGWTELQLDLLFDTALMAPAAVPVTESGAPAPPQPDVRELTRPLWELAENRGQTHDDGRPPLVRFVWGKAWNIPGVVLAVAERLEQFSAGGAPRRSWLRMRMRRVAEPAAQVVPERAAPTGANLPTGDEDLAADLIEIHETLGAQRLGLDEDDRDDAPPPDATERIDQIAAQRYGDPALWRLIAAFNKIANPLDLRPGQPLRLPPPSILVDEP